MKLLYRQASHRDVDALFEVRSKTRENPISKARLAEMGITRSSIVEGFALSQLYGWVCVDRAAVIGFCIGDIESGEVLVLAVLPSYEGRGIGRQLLGRVVEELKEQGHPVPWLAADGNAAVRAHGFYRRLGWVPTGQMLENGDEILVLDSTNNIFGFYY